MSHTSFSVATLQEDIERLFDAGARAHEVPMAHAVFERFREALTHGEIRAAEKTDGRWRVNTWVKQGILVGFRIGTLREWHGGVLSFVGAGTILTRSTPVYDLVNGEVLRSSPDRCLQIPEGAVVVPGSRAVSRGKGQEWGLSLYTPVIVKYRDERTDQSIELEDLLR